MIYMLLANTYNNYGQYLSNEYAEFNASANIEPAASNIVQLLTMIGTFGIVIGIGVACIKMILGDSRDISDAKKRILFLVAACLLLSAVYMLAQTVYDVGKSF